MIRGEEGNDVNKKDLKEIGPPPLVPIRPRAIETLMEKRDEVPEDEDDIKSNKEVSIGEEEEELIVVDDSGGGGGGTFVGEANNSNEFWTKMRLFNVAAAQASAAAAFAGNNSSISMEDPSNNLSNNNNFIGNDTVTLMLALNSHPVVLAIRAYQAYQDLLQKVRWDFCTDLNCRKFSFCCVVRVLMFPETYVCV